MSLLLGAGSRTINLSESPKATEIIKNNNYPQKRIKIDEKDDSNYHFQKSPKTKTDFCEKENISKTSWLKSTFGKESTNEKFILKDNKSSLNSKTAEEKFEVDSTGRMNSSSKMVSKSSVPLSPIDPQNVNKQRPQTLVIEDKSFSNKPEPSASSSFFRNDGSDHMNLVSDQSLNDIWTSLQDTSQFYRNKEEVKDESYSNVLSSWGSFTHPRWMYKKKQRKRADPAMEKKRQNFEWYKEYCKLKTIYTLIEKELKEVQTDTEKYEHTLSIMNDNKERHEDELGYYLGIEDSRKKRVRRLATEIERKHKCLVPKCPKAYGSEGSLNQHLIRKHPLVYEEWMKRITEKENEGDQKKNQLSREEKDEIRKEIEKMCGFLCRDDESNYDDSD